MDIKIEKTHEIQTSHVEVTCNVTPQSRYIKADLSWSFKQYPCAVVMVYVLCYSITCYIDDLSDQKRGIQVNRNTLKE